MSNVEFAAIVTPTSIVFTAPTGKTFTVTNSSDSFDEVKSIVKQLGKIREYERGGGSSSSDEEYSTLMDRLLELVEPAETIIKKSDGKVTVTNGVVYYGDEAIHSALTDRILWGLSEGFGMDSYMLFLENLMMNPSKRAIDQLYGFIEANKMGITDDGHILGYKRVREDFRDIYSGKFDNSPGKIVEMLRNKVDDNPTVTCSDGLHFCSQSYLPHYGGCSGNKIVIVKVHPRDVVSVPVDYNNAKVRACRYEVLSEYLGTDKDDLLAMKPVFNTSEFNYGDDDDDDEEDQYDDSDGRWGDLEDYESSYSSSDTVDEDIGQINPGDMVRCTDDDDLPDGSEVKFGEIYKVEFTLNDCEKICIKGSEGENKFYYSTRFVLATEGTEVLRPKSLREYVDPQNDQPQNVDLTEAVAAHVVDTTEYDRGYDSGFAKGTVDGLDSLVDYHTPTPHSDDVWANGFADGWDAAMLAVRPHISHVEPEMPASYPRFDDAPEATTDYGTEATVGASETVSKAPSHETPQNIPTLAEAIVKPLKADPTLDTFVPGVVTVGPNGLIIRR